MRQGLITGFVLFLGWAIVTAAAAEPPLAPGPAASVEAKALSAERAAEIGANVLPKQGYTLPIKWGDLGVKLVQLGVIDLEKFKKLYAKGSPSPELRRLEEASEDFITITSENQGFLVTVFWGLGLANKNPVLDKAMAERGKEKMMGLASTGGWTLGTKPPAELYSKFDIIKLTPEQEALVADLAQSTYRPCCDNSTAFPDCNHGIALLALMELMAANGSSREEILKASLKFNAFWFPQHYVKAALLFELRGTDWDGADPAELLGSRYSSLGGWRQNVDAELKKLAQRLPAQAGGATCAIPTAPGAGEAQPPGASSGIHHIHGLALDRSDPEVLYVATHTALARIRPNVADPEWVGSHRFDLMGFTTHPADPNLMFASGHPDPATHQETGIANLGLLVSRDGGQTWQTVALKGDADFHALTYSSRDGGQLYGWNVVGETGLYRVSMAAWTVQRLPANGLSGVLSLAASADGTGPLLAGTRTGLMISRDGGVVWAPVAAIPADVPVTAVSYHASDAQVIYAYVARQDLGLMRSRDGGATWERAGLVTGDQTPVVALAVGPGDQVVIATTGSYVVRSRNGGQTWQWVLQRGRLVTTAR